MQGPRQQGAEPRREGHPEAARWPLQWGDVRGQEPRRAGGHCLRGRWAARLRGDTLREAPRPEMLMGGALLPLEGLEGAERAGPGGQSRLGGG